MADFENPFANPEEHNLFQDPSVQQATRSTAKTQPLVDFNPFGGEQQIGSANYGSQGQTSNEVNSSQPAKLQPSSQTAATYGSKWDAEELRRKQEELDRRAAELERREQAMQQNLQFNERRNNFPPLPEWFPIKPCVYQDINVDIPVEFQKTVRSVYSLWVGYAVLLVINIFGSLTYMIASLHNGFNNYSSSSFVLSILLTVIFTPCSFVCWYRPAYKAFQSDSSFNFFLFFFIFFFQFCYSILQCMGIDGWGTVGLLTSITMMTSGSAGAIVAGVIMLVIGLMFGALAALDLIVLLRIHRIYRNTGASFAKAQQELADGVMSNRTVQQTAGNMAASAARATIGQSFSGGASR